LGGVREACHGFGTYGILSLTAGPKRRWETVKYRRELLKGSTDTLLLSLLRGQPMYGYQIIKELKKRSEGYFRFREGTLYPALHRLEAAGLVGGRWERLSSGKERRYYHLTEGGLKLLEEKVAEWQGFSTAVNLVMQPSAG
jgi:PadR family transcriptional regulator PadR